MTRLLAVALFASAFAAHAADPASPGPVTTPAAEIPVAPVIIDGHTLMQLRGLSALPAGQRAREVAARIEVLGENRGFAPGALHLSELGDRTAILAGDDQVMAVVDADAAIEGMANRHLVAEVYRDRIAKAVDRYREERGARYLSLQLLAAFAGVVVTIGLVLLLRWAATRMAAAAQRRIDNELVGGHPRAAGVLSPERIDRTVDGLISSIRWIATLAVVLTGVTYVLALFPWTRIVAVRASALLVAPLRTMGEAIVGALPGLLFIAMLAIGVRIALRVLGILFANIARGAVRIGGFVPEWAWPTYRLVRVAVIAFAVVVAYPYIPGSGSDAFKGVSIFFGLLMSIGAASAVANSLAGYTLIYRRTFRVGDRIRVGDIMGDVVEMRQQVTQLRTVKDELVTIPSSTMLTSEVINYSALAQTQGLILHVSVGVGYETPWRQVEAMLLLVASRVEGIEREPAPFMLMKSLGDFGYVCELNVRCRDAQAMERVYSALQQAILDVFNEYGISLLTPAYQDDPDIPKLVPREQWYRSPAAPPASQAPRR